MPGPSSTRTEPAVHASGLSRAFRGGVRALDGVDLELPAGELVGVIGGNGAGKSTLLRVLFGVAAPDAGSVRVLGLDPRRDRAAVRARAAYVAQEAALDPEMTGAETLRLFHALRGLPAGGRAECLRFVVDAYGLAPFLDRRVGTWSGGQRQRLHLALEAMHAPALLLLDEPTSSLDPEGRRELWRRARAWRDAGNTLLVATHDLAEVAAHADRVLLLHHGRLIAQGPPAALVAAHSLPRTVVTLAREPEAEAGGIGPLLAPLPGVRRVEMAGRTVTLWRETAEDGADPAVEVLAAAGFPARGWAREEPDLADAYFRLTGEAWTPAAPKGRGRRRRHA